MRLFLHFDFSFSFGIFGRAFSVRVHAKLYGWELAYERHFFMTLQIDAMRSSMTASRRSLCPGIRQPIATSLQALNQAARTAARIHHLRFCSRANILSGMFLLGMMLSPCTAAPSCLAGLIACIGDWIGYGQG